MKGLPLITLGLVALNLLMGLHVHNGFRSKFEAMEQIMAEYELKVEAKAPLIKFYTIPGYACDTSNIPGHCTNMWSITQAEYDKKFNEDMRLNK